MKNDKLLTLTKLKKFIGTRYLTIVQFIIRNES